MVCVLAITTNPEILGLRIRRTCFVSSLPSSPWIEMNSTSGNDCNSSRASGTVCAAVIVRSSARSGESALTVVTVEQNPDFVCIQAEVRDGIACSLDQQSVR